MQTKHQRRTIDVSILELPNKTATSDSEQALGAACPEKVVTSRSVLEEIAGSCSSVLLLCCINEFERRQRK